MEELLTNQPQAELPWWQIHHRAYNWVIRWASTPYGLLALIVLALLEPIFVPIPVDILLIALCMANPRKALKYGLICSLVSVLGGTAAFYLGSAVGHERVIEFFTQIGLGSKAALALNFYDKYDFWAISISALTPVPYMLFSWLGGMAGVSISKFILISIIFRTIRFGSEGLIFFFFGRRARNFVEKYFNLATVIVIILLALAVMLMKKIGHLFAD